MWHCKNQDLRLADFCQQELTEKNLQNTMTLGCVSLNGLLHTNYLSLRFSNEFIIFYLPNMPKQPSPYMVRNSTSCWFGLILSQTYYMYYCSNNKMSLRNGSHLPTTQCAGADFMDFATQRNGGRGREKDL
jgi:hypothetical protein